MEGYIKLWRALLKKPIWKQSTPEQKSILITLLLMANHQENEWEWKGIPFKVEKGEFVTSLESIRKTVGKGVSIQQIRAAIIRFKKLQFLTEKSTKSGRLIKIINWDIYQPSQNQPNKEINKDPTKTQHLMKNDKNDKNIKKKNNKKKKGFILPHLGEFKNVKLTSEELDKLEKKFTDAIDRIENLSVYIQSKGDKYKSHYATILNWDRMAKKREEKSIKPKTYAQAQDLERRGRAKWLKEMENDNQSASNQGTDKTIPLLPGD